MQWEQDNRNFKYNLTPLAQEIPIANEELHSTYDQFINLRDTLIFSWKQYSEHPGKKLIVGYKKSWRSTMTVEVQEREYFRQSFEPGYENDNEKITTQILWDYITLGTEQIHEGLLCTINRDGHYRIERKIQMYQLDDQISKIYGSVRHHTKDWDSWQEIPRAVWDYECDFTKTYPGTFSWRTSGTDPNGSCSGSTSTVVSFKLWEIFKKITPEGYIEADLKEWDWLEFKLVKDEQDTPIDSTTYMQPYSNRWSIQYIDLPYNTLK
jgi:hypothetical protein